MSEYLARLDAIERSTAERPASITFTDSDFAEQTAYVEDDSQLKLSFCTRRAGKSFGEGIQLFRDAAKNDGVKCLYLAKTRDSAKGILWHDVLVPLNRKLGLGAKPNLTELSWTLPNGSILRLLGADADQEERDKLLGQKYKTVAIDEAEAFHSDLTKLVYGTLKPAVADRRGSILLNGTPGNLKVGMFYDLTKGQNASAPGRWSVDHQPFGGRWSCHRWSAFQNRHIAEQWAAEIAELKAVNPLIEETPLFQQNYLGIWAVDDSNLVYRYRADRNDFNGKLPEYHRGSWHYVLGIDLGWDDATSFTVGAYHDFDRTLYYVSSEKEQHLDITAVAIREKAIKRTYDIEATVIDGANKQAVEELNQRHGMEAQPADKTGKCDFIDIMNAEAIQGRIKVSPACEPLKKEWAELIWDERALLRGKREEHPSCENHCADGALYLWRHCWQYLAETLPPKTPQMGTAAWAEAQALVEAKQVEEYFEREFERNAEAERQRRELEQWGQ